MAAVLFAVSSYFGWIIGHYRINEISLLIICLLSFISGFYLGLSIYRIRKLTKEKEIQINTKIMILHGSTFILSMLTMFIWVISLVPHDDNIFTI